MTTIERRGVYGAVFAKLLREIEANCKRLSSGIAGAARQEWLPSSSQMDNATREAVGGLRGGVVGDGEYDVQAPDAHVAT